MNETLTCGISSGGRSRSRCRGKSRTRSSNNISHSSSSRRRSRRALANDLETQEGRFGHKELTTENESPPRMLPGGPKRVVAETPLGDATRRGSPRRAAETVEEMDGMDQKSGKTCSRLSSRCSECGREANPGKFKCTEMS